MPGPLATGAVDLLRSLLGTEAPMTRFVIGLEIIVFGLCVAVDRRAPIGIGDLLNLNLPWHDQKFHISTLIRFGALVKDYAMFEPWRLLSAGFLHWNIFHIGMNLWMFAYVGSYLEREMGAARSLVLFVSCVVFGSIASVWWYKTGIMAGASGGVFGQIGAEVGLLYAHRDRDWKRALVTCVIYGVLVSLAFPIVDHAAHAGGFAAGIVLGYALQKEHLRLKLDRIATALAALSLALCVASVGLSTRSPLWRWWALTYRESGLE